MPKYENHTDFYLWKGFKNGDKDALNVIFRRYYPLLHSYGSKLTQDKALTEDCLQDFFLYLYEHRHNLKDVDTIKPYLFKAFRNRLIKYLKANTNLISLETIEKNGLPMEFSAEELMIHQENAQLQSEQILPLLNQLTNKQKELIYLKYYNNLSITDIAEVVGISYQGVLNGLSKTMKKLRKVLAFALVSVLSILF